LKKVLLALALMVLLSMLASAENDSVTTGPYRVSFDLGLPHDTYNVTVQPPTETETLRGDKVRDYTIEIIIKNGSGAIGGGAIKIRQCNLETPLTPEEMVRGIREGLIKLGLINVETSTREIDGTAGAIGVGEGPTSGLDYKYYVASYYPSHDSLVTVSSLYPWDEGTLQLLKTIHIEMVTK